MTPAPIPPNDQKRVEALKKMLILDTPPEQRLDAITRLAQQLFKVPVVLISAPLSVAAVWPRKNGGARPKA